MANAENQGTIVTVNFSGLMLLYQDKKDFHYEVGVLVREIAKGHKFNVIVEPDDVKDVQHFLAMGNKWNLDVVSRSTQAVSGGIDHFERGHTRVQDNTAGQYDFGWIIDFESDEFHPRPLDLIPGCLKPIIHFNSGRFYTKYKSFKLDRKQGDGKFSEFGFIAETSSLEIQLRADEELVLRVADSGPEGDIFRLPHVPGINCEASIENIPNTDHHDYDNEPHDHDNENHFRFYYDAFRDVPKSEQFEFKLKVPETRALNQYPSVRTEHHMNQPAKPRVDSIGSMACGKLKLSKRGKPLE